MDIERLETEIGTVVLNYLLRVLEEVDDNVPTKEKLILDEIQGAILKCGINTNDFMLVDEIVTILNDNGIETGACHDF